MMGWNESSREDVIQNLKNLVTCVRKIELIDGIDKKILNLQCRELKNVQCGVCSVQAVCVLFSPCNSPISQN